MEKLQYRLKNYEGPLDLLLNLVAKNKIDIYDIPIAELLEQYMEQIDLMREADMDVASEFRYRDPVLDERSLFIIIIQSGETADTLETLTAGEAWPFPVYSELLFSV